MGDGTYGDNGAGQPDNYDGGGGGGNSTPVDGDSDFIGPPAPPDNDSGGSSGGGSSGGGSSGGSADYGPVAPTDVDMSGDLVIYGPNNPEPNANGGTNDYHHGSSGGSGAHSSIATEGDYNFIGPIQSGGSSGGTSIVGQPDKPGEAIEKMISAGVMHPSGEMKEISGYYTDPETGTIRFIAKDEPMPMFGTSIVKEKDKSKEKDALKIYQETGLMPSMNMGFTSGTVWQESVFDPPKPTISNRFTTWYNQQKTNLGIGGEPEAKEYEKSIKEYNILQFSGNEKAISEKAQQLENQYAAYEVARGVSPLAKRDIDINKTWAYKAHTHADKIRSDKPTYGGWQGALSRVLNEAIASNVEFIGSAPTLLKYGIGEIVKTPSLIVPLAVVSGVEMGKSIIDDPIQSGATMAVTAGIIKGGARVGKVAIPKPIYRPKSGAYGVSTQSGKYKAMVYPKLKEWSIDVGTGLKGGKFKISPKEQALKTNIENLIGTSAKTTIDFSRSNYRGLTLENVAPTPKAVKISTPKSIPKPKTNKGYYRLTQEPTVKRHGLRDTSFDIIKDIDPKFLKKIRQDIPDKTISTSGKTTKKYGLRDIPEEFIKDIDPKFLKKIRRETPDKIVSTSGKTVKKYGLRDIPEEFIKDIDTKFLKTLKRDIPDNKRSGTGFVSRKYELRGVPKEFIKDIKSKHRSVIQRNMWRDDKASVALTSPKMPKGMSKRLHELEKPTIKNWYEMGKSREIYVNELPQHKSISGNKMGVSSTVLSGVLAATKFKQIELSKSKIKQSDAEKVKFAMDQYDKLDETQAQKVGILQSQKQGQMQDQIQIPQQKYATDLKLDMFKYTVPKITTTKLKPKEKIPKIPLPWGIPKKDQKRRSKKRTTKLTKEDITNPIASVEQFMFKVIK